MKVIKDPEDPIAYRTIHEAARVWGVSTRTLRRWARQGLVVAVWATKDGKPSRKGRWLFPRSYSGPPPRLFE